MSAEDEPTIVAPTNTEPTEPNSWQPSPPITELNEGLPVLPSNVETPINDTVSPEETVTFPEQIDDEDVERVKRIAMELDDVKDASPALKEAIGEVAATKFKAGQKAKRDEESEKQADIDAKATEIKARLESDEPLDAILPALKTEESPSEASDSLDYTDASTLGTPSPVSEDGEWVKHEQRQTGSGLLT